MIHAPKSAQNFPSLISMGIPTKKIQTASSTQDTAVDAITAEQNVKNVISASSADILQGTEE